MVDHVVARALDALARRRNGSGPEKMSGEEENREDEVGRRGHQYARQRWRFRGEGTTYGGSSEGVSIIGWLGEGGERRLVYARTVCVHVTEEIDELGRR